MSYPNNIDQYPIGPLLSGSPIQPYHISTLYDNLSGFEQVIGINPKNGFNSVTARISGVESGYLNLTSSNTIRASQTYANGFNLLTATSGFNNIGISSSPFSGVWTRNINGLAATVPVWNEVPQGVINSSNINFTLVNSPYSGIAPSLQLYKNGMYMYPSGVNAATADYTLLSGNVIKFVSAPISGVSLICNYNYLP